jgi:crossover junction endodeoxyribonuclease RuvC
VSRVIGVDPGKSGAIAVLDGHGELVALYDMPVVSNQVCGGFICNILVDEIDDGPMVAVVEQVHSMPKQGVASSFDFGKSYGIVLGVLAATGIRVMHVPPTRWKKGMRLSADKEQARRRAIERWPREIERFKRKMDADRAEAALLALWWIEQGGKA